MITTTVVDDESETHRGSCNSITALTTGVVSVIITALLVSGVSVAIHIVVYQCVYKRRLKSHAVRYIAGGADLEGDITGGVDNVVYDVVGKRVGTALEMKKNEAYMQSYQNIGDNSC